MMSNGETQKPPPSAPVKLKMLQPLNPRKRNWKIPNPRQSQKLDKFNFLASG